MGGYVAAKCCGRQSWVLYHVQSNQRLYREFILFEGLARFHGAEGGHHSMSNANRSLGCDEDGSIP